MIRVVARYLSLRSFAAKWRQLVAPALILLLLGQFAPLGLLIDSADGHHCPHCATLDVHAMKPGTKCLHPGVAGHEGGQTAANQKHHASSNGPSFCGCGSDDTSLTILPAIGKTLTTHSTALAEPRTADASYAQAEIRPTIGGQEDHFHPPPLALIG